MYKYYGIHSACTIKHSGERLGSKPHMDIHPTLTYVANHTLHHCIFHLSSHMPPLHCLKKIAKVVIETLQKKNYCNSTAVDQGSSGLLLLCIEYAASALHLHVHKICTYIMTLYGLRIPIKTSETSIDSGVREGRAGGLLPPHFWSRGGIAPPSPLSKFCDVIQY